MHAGLLTKVWFSLVTPSPWLLVKVRGKRRAPPGQMWKNSSSAFSHSACGGDQPFLTLWQSRPCPLEPVVDRGGADLSLFPTKNSFW